jgi:hypothetical protein
VRKLSRAVPGDAACVPSVVEQQILRGSRFIEGYPDACRPIRMSRRERLLIIAMLCLVEWGLGVVLWLYAC